MLNLDNDFENDLSIDELLARPLIPNKNVMVAANKKKCEKCNGIGKIGLYAHVKSGKCFDCNGKGFKHI